ncbi:hypothetical protein [Hydrogenophaga sp. T2]|uniref:hypothetical protein n=1 Tax=Hydrogenophaga sp. T2 TaxID=3132823 RepID=UPI003CE6F5CF
MALLGKAALAMWWEVGADGFDGFCHWHAHEHFPERLGIAGFRRATRWREAGGGPGVFVMYELEDHAVLGSPAYLARLNAPTPWSVSMMPLHLRMVRSQCEVLATQGAVTAAQALTVRLSPTQADAAEAPGGLRARLTGWLREWPSQPGLTGAHLLRHRAPPIAQTAEQKIRGGDAVADWVLVVTGYDARALDALAQGALSAGALAALGARDVVHGRYALAYSALPTDMA